MSDGTANHRRATMNDRWLSRERALAFMLVVVTAIVMYLCYHLVLPFLHALAWALALAVIAHPVHRRMRRAVPHANVAAGLSVMVVALLIVVPAIFITEKIVSEAGKYTNGIQEEFTSGRWRAAIERHQSLKPVLNWVEMQLGMRRRDNATATENGQAAADSSDDPTKADVTAIPRAVAPVDGAASIITHGLGSVVSGTMWLLMQLFITLMTLFYFFRDQHHGLDVLRSLMPLSDLETDEVFRRVDDTIHATIYGSVVVGLVQGAMGGLIFWLLGLPSPLTWGAIMGMLAVLPMLGTFVIWAPTAAYLALQGDWTRALILTAWGAIAIGLIDNVLNPFLVGKRLRFHTLLVFFAILGGLALFGASGLILGPLILAVADALLEVWRRRTASGGTIEAGVDCA